MQWELIATWVSIGLTVLTGIYTMGKQSQKINDQQNQITELKDNMKASQETAIEVATMKSDIKYLVAGVAEIKNYIMRKVD